MDYFNDKVFSDQEKSDLGEWITKKLTEIAGECDSVLCEYVMAMVTNAKTMGDISTDLETFIGQPSASEFATSLGDELKKHQQNVDKESNEVGSKSKRVINLKGSSSAAIKEKLEGGLKSSRTGENSARLVQQALGSVQQPKKRHADERNAGERGGNRQAQNRDGSNKRQRNGGDAEGGFVSSSARRREQQHQQHPPNMQIQQGGIPVNQMNPHKMGFNSMEEMMASLLQQNMMMMQAMNGGMGMGMAGGMMMGGPFPGRGYPPVSYPARGGQRGGRSAPWHGRGGPYGRGRGQEETYSTLPSAPTVEGEAKHSAETQGEAALTNHPAASKTGAEEQMVGDEQWHRGGSYGYRGRGGRVPYAGGRFTPRGGRGGRFSPGGRGRGPVSANKTWVAGPGPDVPLQTER